MALTHATASIRHGTGDGTGRDGTGRRGGREAGKSNYRPTCEGKVTDDVTRSHVDMHHALVHCSAVAVAASVNYDYYDY